MRRKDRHPQDSRSTEVDPFHGPPRRETSTSATFSPSQPSPTPASRRPQPPWADQAHTSTSPHQDTTPQLRQLKYLRTHGTYSPSSLDTLMTSCRRLHAASSVSDSPSNRLPRSLSELPRPLPVAVAAAGSGAATRLRREARIRSSMRARMSRNWARSPSALVTSL